MGTPLGRKLNVGRRSISNERWPLFAFAFAGSSGILCMEPWHDKGKMASQREGPLLIRQEELIKGYSLTLR
ncbi:hypothetical protein COCNU_07G015730 [Cocos nucifera]|uniref:Uncharacterized protein n=1 Tax=Cocos nucifera TaxID=13894 RepID=A0A8K0N5R2_COCNU|nr:hypothetical protein COCNU_07G015730 [Cocos nucifera]